MLKDGKKNISSLLSNEQLTYVFTTVISLFDREFVRTIDRPKQIKLLETFFTMYSTEDIYSFFIPLKLHNLSVYVFENVALRDFIFNLTERVSLVLSVKDIPEDELINSLVASVCRNKRSSDNGDDSKSSFYLIPDGIVASLEIHQEELRELFKANFWLIVLYVLLSFFDQTETYKHVYKEQYDISKVTKSN